VIPTEQEFTFHIKFRALGFVKRRTDEFLEEIRKVVKGKKIILLQWDRADSVELYKTKVFPDNDVDIVSIDENDYIGGLHALRYHFLKDNLKIRCDKDLDFSYWGTSKKKKVGEDESGEISGDVRHEVFKEIHKSDLSSCFIGTFDGFARDVKFSKDMRKVAPYIARSKTTLCLNWPGYDEHLTARYNEAMAYDVIPLVWKNYDCNNRLVAIDWQRCYSFEDIQKKCLELRDESVRLEKLSIVKDKHKKSIRNIKYYEEEFDKFLNEAIK
jgi:hypothetical protein